MPLQTLRKRWVGISLILIAGGVFLAELVVAALSLCGYNETFAIYAVGSVPGGYLAARMSPGKTLAEPAIAALLMALATATIDHFKDMGIFAESFTRPSAPLVLGAVAFAGALAGATVGERAPTLSGTLGRRGRLLWSLISMHMLLGTEFILISLVIPLELLIGHGPSLALSVLFMLSAPIIAGVLVQLASPNDLSLTFFVAAAMLTFLIGGLALASGPISALAVTFVTAGGGVMFAGLAFVGARFANYQRMSWGDPLGAKPRDRVPTAAIRDPRSDD